MFVCIGHLVNTRHTAELPGVGLAVENGAPDEKTLTESGWGSIQNTAGDHEATWTVSKGIQTVLSEITRQEAQTKPAS